MKKCQNCSSIVKEEDNFCRNCGKTLKDKNEEQEKKSFWSKLFTSKEEKMASELDKEAFERWHKRENRHELLIVVLVFLFSIIFVVILIGLLILSDNIQLIEAFL